jgi:diketogulonate reductase-like aldo/keto reductase
MANKYGKTTQQILIRYALQCAWTPIVRSSNAAHLAENILVNDFAINESDMAAIKIWDEGDKGAIIR